MVLMSVKVVYILTGVIVMCLQTHAGSIICIICLVSTRHETSRWSFSSLFLRSVVLQLGSSPGHNQSFSHTVNILQVRSWSAVAELVVNYCNYRDLNANV